MSLELPADLEPYIQDYDELHSAGAYALILDRPQDLQAAWEQYYDERPDYWRALQDAATVYYVGGASDLLSRLEDHRNGEVRQTVLTRVCDIQGLQVAWVAEDGDAEKAREVLEPRMARWLARARPDSYVHSR